MINTCNYNETCLLRKKHPGYGNKADKTSADKWNSGNSNYIGKKRNFINTEIKQGPAGTQTPDLRLPSRPRYLYAKWE